MMVTAELTKGNGIDTVDLFEQVILIQYLLLPACVFNTNCVLKLIRKSTGKFTKKSIGTGITDCSLHRLENIHEVFFAKIFFLTPARVSDYQPCTKWQSTYEMLHTLYKTQSL
jgi:hypothetical protein